MNSSRWESTLNVTNRLTKLAGIVLASMICASCGVYAGGIDLQAQIDLVAHKGGGRVVVPAGRHVTGGLLLRSHVELHLEKGAILEGSPRTNDYPVVMLPFSEGSWMAVVMAVGATNVSITGEGEIFGNGTVFRKCAEKLPIGVCQEGLRPRGVFFANCHAVRLEDFTLRDAGCWGCVVQCCENVLIRKLKIDNHATYNNDGIDIEARNAVIADCDIDAGDDGVCLKSNNPEFVMENILVTNCVVRSHCVPLKIGTATHGVVRNVTFTNCRVEAPRRDFMIVQDGIRVPANRRVWCERDFPASDANESAAVSAIALECVDGGSVESVVCRNIIIDGGCYVPIFVRAHHRLCRANRIVRGNLNVMRNLLFENITGHSLSAVPSSVTGVADFRIQNVSFRNVRLVGRGGGENAVERTRFVPEKDHRTPSAGMFMQSLPAYGLWVRHVDGFSLDNVNFSLQKGTSDGRQPVVLDDVGYDVGSDKIAHF